MLQLQLSYGAIILVNELQNLPLVAMRKWSLKVFTNESSNFAHLILFRCHAKDTHFKDIFFIAHRYDSKFNVNLEHFSSGISPVVIVTRTWLTKDDMCTDNYSKVRENVKRTKKGYEFKDHYQKK